MGTQSAGLLAARSVLGATQHSPAMEELSRPDHLRAVDSASRRTGTAPEPFAY